MFANLCEQPAALVFFDCLVIEYYQPHIWLGEYLATPVFVGSMANQPPRRLDDSAYEVGQHLVVREKQHRRRRGDLHPNRG